MVDLISTEKDDYKAEVIKYFKMRLTQSSEIDMNTNSVHLNALVIKALEQIKRDLLNLDIQ